ncbi:microtubule-associated protein [Holotrichia oblita]|uniref:Microtubule-associated protein n=1 Tax=Holotrichia oblita TaxID=644536 RepID=A0ACB9SWC5_HOLOL|nr:microtubule-associated protein [Holotrichia oblita]
MSQQQNTVINGPASETSQSPTNTVKGYTTTYDPQRPPLVRLDSKTNLSPRLGGYPNQQGGGQFRPGQPRPQFTGNPQQFAPRPQLQRNPSSGQFNLAQAQGGRPLSPNPTPGLRPVTPYPKGGQQPVTSPRSPTNLYQQKTFPATSPQFTKEQNLDTTLEPIQQIKDGQEYTVQSSDIIEEEEPRSILNITNLDDQKHGSEDENEVENQVIKDEPIRPESRNQKNYEDEIAPPTTPKKEEISHDIQETRLNKPEALNPNDRLVNEDRKKVERKSPSPEPPKTPRNQKMTLNFEEQNRPKSPKLHSNKSEDRSPTTPGRKIPVEKPKTLKPEVRTVKRNGLVKSPTKSVLMRLRFVSEGDNDSGVDESTQGNDQSSNGDHNSPRKSSSGKNTARQAASSPTKIRSLSRGSKSPNLKTPDSPTPSIQSGNDKKKVPMNKVHVGAAPSPNIKEVKSKIGSLQNTSYRPGGGNVKIEHKKIDLSKTHSKIAAKNENYIPGGGEKKIEHRKLQWNVSSKIGSLDNTSHKPKGGEKKIETIKLDFKDKAKSKVGSKDNIKYQPGGGDVKVNTIL